MREQREIVDKVFLSA